MPRLINVFLSILILLAMCPFSQPVEAAGRPVRHEGALPQYTADGVWNTFLGNTDGDQGNAIAVDSSGNTYIVGYSSSTWGAPLRPFAGGEDAFVVKLNSSGGIVWQTFLGGSGNDRANGVSVDASGNIYVVGESWDTWQGDSAPKRAFGAVVDAFVVKLNNNGGIVWNTFLGGYSIDWGMDIALDPAGNIYIGGISSNTWQGDSAPKRAYTADDDAFAAKLNNNGALQWNTFLGGSDDDRSYGVAADNSGNVYVAGYSDGSWGDNIRRAYSASSDAFAAMLNTSGDYQWNTFLGEASIQSGNSIVVDASGNVYVCGYSQNTWGTPVRDYQDGGDGFVARLNGAGDLQWNTFQGGDEGDSTLDLVIGSNGNLYLTGHSEGNWPGAGSPVHDFGGDYDAFGAVLNSSSGVLAWYTFMGGSGDDEGNRIALDNGGNLYITGFSDATWGSPVRPYAGDLDAFVVKLTMNGATRTNQAAVGTTLGTVNLNTNAGYITNAGWIPAVDIRCSAPSGYSLPYGMFSFNINGLTAGQTARIMLKFPNPLPLGTKYYKCINGSMVDVTSLVTRIDEYTLQLALTDGGLGDADGAANGTIVDPGGPAFPFKIQPQSSSATMPQAPQKPVSLSNISVKSASLSATKVTPGSPVTVTANVANTGTGNGTSMIKVYVNGTEDASQGVSVNSGGTSTVTFDVTRNEPGTYAVYVGGTQAGSFTVDQFTPDTILFISGALVFFALILGMVYVSRKRV